MSHYYHIHCPECNEDSQRYDRAQEALVSAVLAIPSMKQATKNGWEISGFKGYRELGGFLANHALCSPLEIVGEYPSDLTITIGANPDRVESVREFGADYPAGTAGVVGKFA